MTELERILLAAAEPVDPPLPSWTRSYLRAFDRHLGGIDAREDMTAILTEHVVSEP